jgi:uncharacterized protein YdcH (DUF465 family)
LTDNEIVDVILGESENFKRLSEEHRELDQKLMDYQNRLYLSPDEEFEKKRMQKLKLQKKDLMAEMVRDYKKNMPDN